MIHFLEILVTRTTCFQFFSLKSSFLSNDIYPEQLPHHKHTYLCFISALRIRSMDLFSRLTVWLTDLNLFAHKAACDAIFVKTLYRKHEPNKEG